MADLRALVAVAVLALASGLIAVGISSPGGSQGAGPAGNIDTFAGGGAGDGEAPLDAPFVGSGGIAIDPTNGDVLVADAYDCRVRRISATSMVTAVGSGYCAFGGDGGAPTSAKLSSPTDVAVSATGDIYVADYGNCRIRLISGGSIQTIAGTGTCASGADSGLALSISLQPAAIELDGSGDLLIADAFCRVRKLSAGTITTIAGTGVCGIGGDGGPATSAEVVALAGLTVDSSGDIYISQSVTCRVRRISGGIIDAFAGDGTCSAFGGDGGPPTAAQIHLPGMLAVDGGDSLYIAEFGNCRIRKVAAGIISTFAGTGILSCSTNGDGGLAVNAALNEPAGIAIDTSGTVYVGQRDNCRVRAITAGVIDTIAGMGICSYYGEGVPAGAAALSFPRGVAIDALDNVYIADTENCRIREVSAGQISTIAGHGAPMSRYCTSDGTGGSPTAAGLSFPQATALAPNGDLYFAEGCQIRRISGSIIQQVAGAITTCGFSGDGGPAPAATIESVASLAIASNGDVYIGAYGCRLRRISSGVIDTVAGNGTCGFSGDGGLASAAIIYAPLSLAVNAASEVFLVQSYSGVCRIRKIDTGGVISTIVGTGTCGSAGDGGAADEAEVGAGAWLAISIAGDLFIAADCVVRYVHSGVIDRIAGSPGQCEADGDGGPALSATLRHPGHMAFDSAGNLYVAEYQGRRVRIIYGAAATNPTATPTATDSPTATSTSSPAETWTVTPSPAATGTPTATTTPQPTDTPLASPTGSSSPTAAASLTPALADPPEVGGAPGGRLVGATPTTPVPSTAADPGVGEPPSSSLEGADPSGGTDPDTRRPLALPASGQGLKSHNPLLLLLLASSLVALGAASLRASRRG